MSRMTYAACDSNESRWYHFGPLFLGWIVVASDGERVITYTLGLDAGAFSLQLSFLREVA